MRIAKTAALVMAMTPILALAQQHKPSPATSVTSVPSSPSATQATLGLQPAINPYRRNPGSTAGPTTPQPMAARSVMPVPEARPVSPMPAPQVAPQAVPTSIATSMVSVPVAQPAVTPAAPSAPTVAVNYAQGQLTVVSQSASLGAVLKLISAKTGAVIDLAPELQNEPVIAQIGPSAVREVMTALLDSPKIDYIIMGSGNASGGLEQVLVRTRQSFGRNGIAMNGPVQSAPAEAPEFRFNANGAPAGVAKPQTALTQEQLVENWKKIREEKKQAEIAQQQQDRETEASQVEPPQPEPQPEPQPTNAVPDNPPLK
ncbi:MAG TPA: hypothetical protein VHV32_13675 [Candidatus Angelobacter sp.]|nr:hypothetical protein [Candidatus Angelobacter sp.]